VLESSRRLIKRALLPLGLRLGNYRQHPPRPPEWEREKGSDPLNAKGSDPFTHSGGLPSITIVTPSLNQGRFLEATIRSVLDQRSASLEYIVQDGGSRDGSVEIIRRHADRLARWESSPDRGQAAAINRGFAGTRGSIMAWLNSDDLLLPGALHHIGRFFSEHPETDVVYGHRVVIDEDGCEIGRWILPAHRRGSMIWRNYIPQETMFWRRELWERTGGKVDESFDFAIDCELVARFERAGATLARLPRFLGAFRVHGDQKSVARLAKVGRPEFARIRRMYAPGTLASLTALARSTGVQARSMICTWGYLSGMNRF
jgi:glycosyltransferase involved in cell wall biosynthesis